MRANRSAAEQADLSRARRLEARANSLRGGPERDVERNRLLRIAGNIRAKIRKSHAQ